MPPDEPPARPIRVLIVDDEPLIRSGLRHVLQIDPGIDIVGEAADGTAAIAVAAAHRPDVVLMDVRMPGMAGPEATEALLARLPAAKVLAITSFDAEEQLLRMLISGAIGYLLKDEEPHRIVDAIRRTAAGETVLSPRSTSQLIRRVVAREDRGLRDDAVERFERLTDREREIARRVAEGRTNAEIGERLHLAAATVKTHLEQIHLKLGVRNRQLVAVLAERAGLGPEDL